MQHFIKEGIQIDNSQTSQVVLVIKNQQEKYETQVWSLGWEDSLEEGTATHSSILAWKIPWSEEPSRLWPTWLQRVRHDWSSLAHIQIENKKEKALNLSSHQENEN